MSWFLPIVNKPSMKTRNGAMSRSCDARCGSDALCGELRDRRFALHDSRLSCVVRIRVWVRRTHRLGLYRKPGTQPATSRCLCRLHPAPVQLEPTKWYGPCVHFVRRYPQTGGRGGSGVAAARSGEAKQPGTAGAQRRIAEETRGWRQHTERRTRTAATGGSHATAGTDDSYRPLS